MVICIVGGRGGTGKTSQIRMIAQMFPTMWSIMEKKDEDAIKTIKEINAELIYSIDEHYNVEPQKTLNAFAAWRDSVLTQTSIKCIVVDGISDLRSYAIDEWIILHPLYDKMTGEPRQRASIGAENIGGWGDVNKRVQTLLTPLINYALYNKVHLFMTAQMKDVYMGNKRIGQELDIKDWIEYPSECLLVFTKDKRSEHYECSCEKSPLWSNDSGWVEELRKDTGLLEVLSIHKLI